MEPMILIFYEKKYNITFLKIKVILNFIKSGILDYLKIPILDFIILLTFLFFVYIYRNS
jgi:hypothetical protein